MRAFAVLLFVALLLPVFAGCLAGSTDSLASASADAPYLGYAVAEPDLSLKLVEFDVMVPGDAVEIHARIVKPEGDGPFPVIVQFTPYTAPGENVMLDALAEPVLGNNAETFDREFVRRGYAFAYADVRGTGDSTGCLDLRGPRDIADIGGLAEALGTMAWSNGKVGFIGASYPGSEAHMAALANSPYVGAVIPVVASTSFYHYHHNDGVPYVNHGLGSTNAGYTQYALQPTLNPDNANFVARYLEETQCPYFDNMFTHGGLDQTGAYYEWWQERNLRSQAPAIKVPVLMAQGLADWNVKPDHIATWFNDLQVPKTLIAGQWGHQYPKSPCKDDLKPPACDDSVPYGDWWAYATAFFDTYLKGIDTGMFTSSTAWIQANDGKWHRSAEWPLIAPPEELVFHLRTDGNLANVSETADGARVFYGCPNNARSQGAFQLAQVEGAASSCRDVPDQTIAFETAPFAQDMLLSGVPLLNLVVDTGGRDIVHLVAVLQTLDANGDVMNARENYGYLNPLYRNGLLNPEPLPAAGEHYNVTIDFYPQEDLVKAGQSLRLILAHDDGGRTIEVFEEGETRVLFGAQQVNTFMLPLRPASLSGVRMT